MKMEGNLEHLNDEEMKQLLPNNLIFLGYRGSIAHGMYVPNTDPNSIDDKDIIGIFIAPKDYYIGLRKFLMIPGLEKIEEGMKLTGKNGEYDNEKLYYLFSDIEDNYEQIIAEQQKIHKKEIKQ